jgi:primosomal protein N' (replication factor Y)
LRKTIAAGRSAVVLLPDVQAVMDAAQRIAQATGKAPLVLYRNQPKELDAWINVRGANNTVVVGTRSSVFAPLKGLGLIIIDEEENSVYKQDQVPHYHARVAALMRTDIEKLNLILASSAPSLESFYLAQNKTLTLKVLPRQSGFPEAKTMDPGRIPVGSKRSRFVFTKFLEDSIYSTLSQKGKVLLFLNRKGFATTSSCHNCGYTIKCERCNINLVYYFDLDLLKCHYCNFKIQPPKICPKCNSGYVKFSGAGTQKIESELHRMFPQASIKNFDGSNDEGIRDADIVVSTSVIMKQASIKFDLIGVLALDNSLNRVEIRSSEKVFQILSGLAGLTDKKMIIETYLGGHHVFEALSQKDAQLFYDKELEQRKQLGFVPYSHMAIVKLRAKTEEKARKASQELFDILLKSSADEQVKVLSLNPGQPAKLRGNYYWNILLSSGKAEKITGFLKINLRKFSHSGIIVTVDVDPL